MIDLLGHFLPLPELHRDRAFEVEDGTAGECHPVSLEGALEIADAC